MIDNLHYELEDVDLIIRRMRKEWFEKGSDISVLRLHILSMRIRDLLEALDNLSVVEKRLIGG